MSSFFDRALPRRDPDAQVSCEEDRVSYRLADERLERRERARARVNSRTGERRET